MITITGGGSFTRQNISDINNNFASVLPFTPGNLIYLWPSYGNPASSPDGSVQRPYTDIASAYGAGRANKNDVIVLVGNGAASGSARLSANFTWAKTGLHLIGITEPGLFSQRARIAPTAAVTAFANFFTVSASGCYFQNVQWFQGFTTGTTSQICMTVTGSNNTFQNCHVAGMGDTDAGSGTSTGSRSLKIGSAGSGENTFNDCVIGLDTEARTVANASLELAGGTPRNVFRRCIFPFYATGAGVLGILGTGNSCIDRTNYFEDCTFSNAIKSGSGTAMTALISFTTASPGGLLALKRCMTVGVTKFGDTNGLANTYIDMPAVSASAGGLGVNPS